jgi:hypothetical protein
MRTFRIFKSIFEVESHVGVHSTIFPQGETGSDLEHVIDCSEVIRCLLQPVQYNERTKIDSFLIHTYRPIMTFIF